MKGFTLIELTITIAVILVASHIATLNFSLTERRQIQSVAEELKNNIRYTQRLAIAENKQVKLFFDKENKNSYFITKKDGMSETTLKTIVFPEKINLRTTNNSEIHFTPKGTIDKASRIILESNNYTIELTLSIGTGKVDIKEVQKKA